MELKPRRGGSNRQNTNFFPDAVCWQNTNKGCERPPREITLVVEC